METARQQFPRLYFLSKEEMVEILAISRNPKSLQPYAIKCFSGITGLSYALPATGTTGAFNSALDYALNGEFTYFLE